MQVQGLQMQFISGQTEKTRTTADPSWETMQTDGDNPKAIETRKQYHCHGRK